MKDKNPRDFSPHQPLQYMQGDLQPLLFRIKKRNAISEKVMLYFDDVLTRYCQISNIEGNRLTLIVPNAAIATHLRFIIPDLLKKFKQDAVLQVIKEIHSKVAPITTLPALRQKKPQRMPLLSNQTACFIQQMAATLKDEKLRLIMERIAMHKIDKIK